MTTNVTRWSPWDELTRLWPADLLGRMRPVGELTTEWNPRCDVTDSETEVVVEAEIPGVEPKDIEITVSDSTMTIRGEKKSEKVEDKDGRKYTERFFGSFERSFAIPRGARESDIEATMKDGVLVIRLPKPAAEQQAARRIEIKPS